MFKYLRFLKKQKTDSINTAFYRLLNRFPDIQAYITSTNPANSIRLFDLARNFPILPRNHDIIQRNPASSPTPKLEPRLHVQLPQPRKASAGSEIDDLHGRLPDGPFPLDGGAVGLGPSEGDDARFVGEEELWIHPAANDPQGE